jgi:hypothetical protein
MDVGDGGFLKQIAELFLAQSQSLVRLAESRLYSQSFDRGAHARPEDPHYVNAPRTIGHRLIVKNRDVTKNAALRI